MPYQRISVRGTSGSGKSTLARSVAKRLQIPCVELDALYHLPNWQESTDEEFIAKVQSATAGDRWVVDGNYRVVRDVFESRADTVLWLDYHRPLIMYRVIRRTFLRAVLRQECCNGNLEDLRRTFTRDSVIVWAYTTHARRRQQCEEFFSGRHQDFEATQRFRSPKEADRWLRSLETPTYAQSSP